MTGLVSISRAAAPAAGSWLMHSASRRRRLAAYPAFAMAAMLVSSLLVLVPVPVPVPRLTAWLVDGGLDAKCPSFRYCLAWVILQDR
jgi:hypothetical protein